MRKVKKIKKIPKYYNGELAVKANPGEGVVMPTTSDYMKYQKLYGNNAATSTGNFSFNENYKDMSTNQKSAAIAGAVGAGADLYDMAASGQKPTVGTALSGIAKGASAGAAFGPVGAIVGAAVGLAAGTAGGRATLDRSKISSTSNINDAVSHNTGWIGGLMGADRDALLAQASGIQNSKMATEQTANKQLEWANDPRNQGMVSTLKEGGIVPGEHYASRNEVEVDANGNNAVRYKWDPKGKDTYHIMFNPDGSLTEGNMIFNDEGVRRPDGTKYSDTADKMIKNIKDPKLRKISLKKLAAEQEEQKAKEGKTKNGIPAHEKGGIQWNDLAYQTAAMLTPLLDKEKAETTRLQRPTWKAAPVAVDVLNQLQDAQLGYTLANYNTAQGGYTAGQQLAARGVAASNLAKQRAAIHQLQTEQQNKNIAQNIASYNNYANIIADIANKETDMNAANRATARNINRQNKAAALKTWGQINNDQNKRKMDKLRIAAAAPMFEYGIENYDEMVKMLTEMGLWQ